MIENFIYIPKYVKQDSDLEYGEKVTHENYNEKLNLNTTQGDYNTQVLDWLLNDSDPEVHVHIPYLDRDINRVRQDIETINTNITNLDTRLTDDESLISSIQTTIENIQSGTTAVGHADTADTITSASTAGPNKYYGTNSESEVEWIDVPEFLYAVPMESSAGVDGVYYVPAINSVAENMLTEAVREKLNRTNITDYDYLSNRPLINGVLLTGNVSLSDLGVQPAGSYVTDTELATTLNDYATTSSVTTALTNYATNQNLQLVSDAAANANTAATDAYNLANGCAHIYVDTIPAGVTPKVGDLWVKLN